MKLIGSLTSPYVRKVRVVLAEKKIDYDFELENPWLPDTRISQNNPLGKVPVLLLDDGTSVFDSRVIVGYLDATAPNNRLIPASGRERMLVRRWEALADGITDAAVAAFLENKRESGERSENWIQRQRGKILAGLEMAAAELGEDAWCHGTAISLADIALGAALGYLDFRFADIDWRASHANLAKLQERLMQRPSFQDTVPKA